jgi:hypothetical protein
MSDRITYGGQDVTKDIWDLLRRRFHSNVATATKRLASYAKAGGERFFLKGQGGGGYVKMQVDPVSYHYWGCRLGYACWKDEQFCREYLRDNEYARVRNRNANPTVGWVAGQDAAASYLGRETRTENRTLCLPAAGTVRWTKHYAT